MSILKEMIIVFIRAIFVGIMSIISFIGILAIVGTFLGKDRVEGRKNDGK